MNRLSAPALPEWINCMLPSGIDRYLVDVGNGRQMHVMECGEGRPVLLMHGNPTWGFLYRKVASALTGLLSPPEEVGGSFECESGARGATS